MIKEFLEKIKDRKQMQKEIETEHHVMKKIQQRAKSANERELEKFMEEKRQKIIEAKVKAMRKEKLSEFWKSNAMQKQPRILDNNEKLISGGKSILKAKRIF